MDEGASSPSPVVELEHVTRRYDVGSGVVTALEDVSLQVDAGEFVVVLGPSGSGKTTLLNMIGALDVPTSADGSTSPDASSPAPDVASSPSSVDRRSASSSRPSTCSPRIDRAGERPVRHRRRTSSPRPRTWPAQVLEQVGLADRLAPLLQPALGRRAAARRHRPCPATGSPVLLADEPTGELDFRTGVQILELLQAQAERRLRRVIVVTHNREISRCGRPRHRAQRGSTGARRPARGRSRSRWPTFAGSARSGTAAVCCCAGPAATSGPVGSRCGVIALIIALGSGFYSGSVEHVGVAPADSYDASYVARPRPADLRLTLDHRELPAGRHAASPSPTGIPDASAIVAAVTDG